MSERFGSFENKFLVLENPLPAITLEELHKRARVTLRKPKLAKQKVFDLDLRYGGGVDLETKTLRAGEKIRVTESFGRQVIEDFKPQGDICSTNPGLAWYSKEEERAAAINAALLIAEQHYHTVGAHQIDGVRDMRRHTQAEVEQFRSTIYSTYFLAQAKEELIRETREKFLAQGQQRKAG